jgi:hypothetical protein
MDSEEGQVGGGTFTQLKSIFWIVEVICSYNIITTSMNKIFFSLMRDQNLYNIK